MSVDSRVRRVRRPDAPAPVAPTRGLRRTISGTVTARTRGAVQAAPDTRRVEALVARHMQAVADAESAAIRVKDTFVELEKAMQESGLKECRAGDWIAEYVSAKGRTSNVIDPAGFYKLCSNKADFFGAVSVNATEAKRILPAKTLDTVTTKIEGKTSAPSLKVGKVK